MAVVNPNAEIGRLRELMPATARMKTKLMLNERQLDVIKAEFPRPWQQTHAVSINLDRWHQLSVAERDLLFLRTVCWVTLANVLKPNWYQALAGAGLAGGVVELAQGDAVGVLAAAGVAALAGWQIWRGVTGPQIDIAADDKAVQVAQRRGYDQAQAAEALIRAIEAVPPLEGRQVLTVNELIRCQNLRVQTGRSEFSVPESYLR
ncbi:DUF3318 domain-containing protein [Nodosilinea sp. E11]|uniref:DUF3318 domain-containing protein n=1 Tax=Nodosilinea sp. E11 TaxID=3037479 RepID=UPI002934D3E5|nr:DUF3318 domain-containing protein [Nodosilinea sp. E11]WOD42023.1 DUF3318 domain-containing protein [Nodosilinea sp. E11]